MDTEEFLKTQMNEQTVVVKAPEAFFVGRLQDFGLGSENGIPSSLAGASEEELRAYCKKLPEAIVTVEDRLHPCCIDGRCRQCNADGTQPKIRRSHVGATGTLPAVAM